METKYICKCCDELFDTPSKRPYASNVTSQGETEYDEDWLCPHCESSAVYEATKCDKCNNWFLESELKEVNGKFICEECEEEENE